MRQDKAGGADELVPRLLILIKDEISYLLTVLFKKSLAQGVVPEDWKRASVSPIYKKGNKNIAENYRPVSLTSQCSKLMESIIRDAIVQYLEANFQLLKDSQHGFRTGRSVLRIFWSFWIRLLNGWTKEWTSGGCRFLGLFKSI